MQAARVIRSIGANAARPASLLRRVLLDGTVAGTLGTALLAWRGSAESASAAAPLNAVSHWLWGDRSLRSNAASWRYTGLGTATNLAASLLWAGLYELLQTRRRIRAPLDAAVRALAVAAVAALVDFRLVPKRLTPGFEHRLSTRSLLLFYGAFAAGLALGGLAFARRR